MTEQTNQTTQKEETRFAFNEKSVGDIPLRTDGKQVMYYDTESKLCIRVGAKKKVFCVMKRLPHRGAPIRVNIGEYGDIPVKKAVELSYKAIGDIASGVNKIEVEKEKKKKEAVVVANKTETLGWLFDQYEENWLIKKKGGKDGSLKSHSDAKKFFTERKITLLKQDKETGVWEEERTVTVGDWMNRPWRSITKKEVLARFELFARAKKARNKKDAPLEPMIRTNQIAFKGLHSAYNYILKRTHALDDTLSLDNPASVITAFSLWEPTNVVEDFIDFSREEGALWWNAVIEYRTRNLVAAHYILFSLLQTGRSIDICNLKWDDVDMKEREIVYERTKNGEKYILYITDLALEILKELKKISKNEYVFYYPESKLGYIPQAAKQHFKNIAARGGKLISHHDLRRTWATPITGRIDKLTADYCLKHKLAGVDAHYYKNNREVVRASMQKMEDYFLEKVALFPRKEVPADRVEEVA
ncbi:tyrosine-type recombinase/integrase [Paraburkholderia aromaticivorans]|uniref:tyrosine-type recombinase/integrase n=1 Tax=Paraburkholderia aromaticivorans TaxID=2026199 RepID=UPI0038BD567D